MMIDSIYIAMSGLNGYQKGLQVISNDSANLNTPGFKGSNLQFADMFSAAGNPFGGSQGSSELGSGLNMLGTVTNFQQGQFQNTGNNLDLAIDGAGFFVLKDKSGNIHYTRDGQFKFDNDGTLLSATTGEQVMAMDAQNSLVPVSIANSKLNASKATSNIVFEGNLLVPANQQGGGSTAQTFNGVTVIDKSGTTHSLQMTVQPDTANPGSWTVELLDGATSVGKGSIAFINGQPDPTKNKINLTYTPNGQAALALTLDFSGNVTAYGTDPNGSQTSTLKFSSQDGYAPGQLTTTAFDATGTLILTYSNGQTVKGGRLALRRSNVQDAIKSVGNNEYISTEENAWTGGYAGDDGFGSVKPGMVEMSNVDLSQEFSNLVIMQRGYQASAQVVSTANEMLTDLFSMRGK